MLTTLDVSSKTLAVFLLAATLFACAALLTLIQTLFLIDKGIRLPFQSGYYCLAPLYLVLYFILTPFTRASLSAIPALDKAFAIQF